MKLSLIITGMFGLVVIIAIGSTWAPAASVASAALVEAREDQLRGISTQVKDQVVAYFMAATKMMKIVEELYRASHLVDPVRPTEHFIKHHSSKLWHALTHSPTVASCWVSQMRDPQYTDTDCTLDVGLVSRGYIADVNNLTAGNYSSCPVGYARACDMKARLAFISGMKDIVNPTRIVGTLANIPCKVWMLASVDVLWRKLQVSPNEPTALSHSVPGPVWGRGYPAVVGSPPNQAVYHGVFAPVPGPPWAPDSGLIQCGVRLSKTVIKESGERDLIDVLSESKKLLDLDTTLFLLTPRKTILATSYFDFIPEETLSNNFMLGLKRYDNRTVPAEVTEIASWAVNQHCQVEDTVPPGQFPCNFTGIAELTQIGAYTVAFSMVQDPMAANLDMVLAVMVKSSEIRDPATQLNKVLAIIGCCALVICCGLAFVFGVNIASPIVMFRDRLVLATELTDLAAIANEPVDSMVTEIAEMKKALSVLAKALLEYKSFLPQGIADASDSDGVTVGEESLSQNSDSLSRATTMTHQNAGDRVKDRTRCRLESKYATIMFINLSDFNSSAREASSLQKESCSFVSLIKSGVTRGAIDRFNGDRVMCSFNVSGNCKQHIIAAMTAATVIAEQHMKVRESMLVYGKPMGIGFATGKVYGGNAGSDDLRSFNIIGKAVTMANRLCDAATSCSTAAMIFCDDGRKPTLNHEIRLVGRLFFTPPLCGELSTNVMEVVEEKQNQEWMYNLQQDLDNTWDTRVKSCLADEKVDWDAAEKYPKHTRCHQICSSSGNLSLVRQMLEFDSQALRPMDLN
eukprot:TRINITY_DN24315_c0_g1_i1.p1 TRINITY_DN24315_c0_g1~~TRINITY_DN24315_c0_g1_i1.p1  ORF type:complete len:832 (+),score=121.08 TRINITY_DN24315_c0_g1_i1:98-2497(+)